MKNTGLHHQKLGHYPRENKQQKAFVVQTLISSKGLAYMNRLLTFDKNITM